MAAVVPFVLVSTTAATVAAVRAVQISSNVVLGASRLFSTEVQVKRLIDNEEKNYFPTCKSFRSPMRHPLHRMRSRSVRVDRE